MPLASVPVSFVILLILGSGSSFTGRSKVTMPAPPSSLSAVFSVGDVAGAWPSVLCCILLIDCVAVTSPRLIRMLPKIAARPNTASPQMISTGGVARILSNGLPSLMPFSDALCAALAALSFSSRDVDETSSSSASMISTSISSTSSTGAGFCVPSGASLSGLSLSLIGRLQLGPAEKLCKFAARRHNVYRWIDPAFNHIPLATIVPIIGPWRQYLVQGRF